MRVRRLWPVALLLLTPVLAACGDDEDGPGGEPPSSSPPLPSDSVSTPDVPSPTTSPTDASTTATSAAPGALPSPCDVVSAADVTAAYGETFVRDGLGGGTTSQQGIEWTSKNCNFEVDDRVEVTVKLTGPGDFTKGSFQCVAPSDISGIVAPADVTGATSAWWKTNEAPPLEATLRACTDSVIVEIEIEYDDGVSYEGDPQNQSAVLAEGILAKL